MSASISMAQTPILWDENSILNNGIQLIREKNSELKYYTNLWKMSLGGGYYSDLAVKASEDFKASTIKSIKQFELLNKSVTDVINANPQSDKIKELKKISKISRIAQSYFTSVLNNYKYPTLFRWAFYNTRLLSKNVLLGSAGLLFTSLVLPKGFLVVTPYIYQAWRASLVSYLTCISIEGIESNLLDKSHETKMWKTIFDKAVYPNKVKSGVNN